MHPSTVLRRWKLESQGLCDPAPRPAAHRASPGPPPWAQRAAAPGLARVSTPSPRRRERLAPRPKGIGIDRLVERILVAAAIIPHGEA